jgi:hypothetical protein
MLILGAGHDTTTNLIANVAVVVNSTAMKLSNAQCPDCLVEGHRIVQDFHV